MLPIVSPARRSRSLPACVVLFKVLIVASCSGGGPPLPPGEMRVTPIDWNGVPAQDLDPLIGTNGTWSIENGRTDEDEEAPNWVLYHQVWVDGQCIHNSPEWPNRSGGGMKFWSQRLTVGLKEEPHGNAAPPEAPRYRLFMASETGYSEAMVELPRRTRDSHGWVRREPLVRARAGADIVLLAYVQSPETGALFFDANGTAQVTQGAADEVAPYEHVTGVMLRLLCLDD